MFPLAERKLIRGFAAHIKAGLGGAADYRAHYVPLFSPFDGRITNPFPWTFDLGSGGKWLRLTRINGEMIDFAHLSLRIKTGIVKAGDRIATTGNSGYKTSGPHLHLQITRGGTRLDPEKYDWNETDTVTISTILKQVWGVPGAQGDIAYFQKRWDRGDYKTEAALRMNMAYWNDIRLKDDARWQREKKKVLG